MSAATPDIGRATLRAVPRVLEAARPIVLRAAWLVVAIIVAVGGAGIVAALDHFPGTTARTELTYAADTAAMHQLDTAAGILRSVTDNVVALGNRGRFALASVAGQDLDRLDAALADGTQMVATIEAQGASLRQVLGAVPGIGPDEVLVLSEGVRARYEGMIDTLQVVDGLADDWRSLTKGAADASRLTVLLDQQEKETAAAAGEGVRRRYREALTHLDKADAALDEATRLRDRLANAADVTTLDRWLARNRTYVKALRGLYQALVDSKGRTTAAVRNAFAAERAAHARLPGDNRALIIIMADVAQGGLNQAVIAIELARGSLEEALTVADQTQAGPLPTPAG